MLTKLAFPIYPPPQGNPCLTAPAGICYLEVVYQSGNITIPNSSGGYDVYFQDFARNQSLTNIVNPGTVGMTTTIRIPDPGTYACNSSPNFVNLLPTVICLNDTFSFDHSATDPDGDSLSYYLCDAFDDTPNAPPFNVVPYAPKPGGGNYSGTYPIHANPPTTINPVTGVFKGKPILVGNYTIVICVDEIRNGVVIGTYTREMQINVTSCNATATAAIQSEPPTAGAVYGGVFGCKNFTVNFVNTSINSYFFFWDFGDPTVTTDTSSLPNPSYTYPDTGVYTARLIASPGFPCADTVFVYVRVFPGMKANFGISEPHCVGFPIYFTDSSTSLYGSVSAWSWQFGNGPISNLQNTVNTYPFQSIYNVRLIAEDSKGCKDTLIKPVSVFNPPTANITEPIPICLGDSVSLQVTASAGTYSWAPAAGLSCTTCKQPKASPASNTIYTLSVTGAGGCTNFDTVLVIATPPPIVNAGPDEFLCNAGFVELQATVTSTTSYSLLWSPSTGLNFVNILNPIASPTTTTTYVLAVTTTNGCVITDTLTVFVDSISIDAGSNQTICMGDTVQLNGMINPGNNPFHWSPSFGLSDTGILMPDAFPLQTTRYILTVYDTAIGCQNQDSVLITVNTPTLDTIYPVTCISYTVPSGNTTYTVSGTYYDTVTNSVGCESFLTIQLTLNPFTTGTLDTTACGGYTVPSGSKTYTLGGTYEDSLTSVKGCDSFLTIHLVIIKIDTSVTANPPILTANAFQAQYQWMDCNSGSIIPGANNQTFHPSNNGRYAVILYHSGCEDTSSCHEINMVGIPNYPSHGNISIFPNPTSGSANLNITGTGYVGEIEIQMLDIMGKTVLKQKALMRKSYATQIDLSKMPIGPYIVCVELGGEILREKILIIR